MKYSLEEKLKNLPVKPGVYLFKDRTKKVIYVGKAKRLRSRVRSYFQNGRIKDPKYIRLVKRIDDLEIILTDSEIEALILEANLVKEYKPKYNVNLKDDKSFPYIRLTNELFPRIFPTRKIIKDGSKYFGPYTDVRSMKSLLKTVKRIFPIRGCNLNLAETAIADKRFKVCLNYHIHKCLGPCEGLISKDEYAEIIKHIIDFINGRDTIVIEELRKKMNDASAKMEFEKAARIRDQLSAIKDFQYKQKVVSPEEIDQDLVAVAIEDNAACGVIFKIREGRVIGRQHYYLDGVESESMTRILSNFITQYYLKADFIPQEILVPSVIEDSAAIVKWLSQKAGKAIKVKYPSKGEKAKLIGMAMNNARLLLDELKLQQMKSSDYIPNSVKALQRDLNLKNPPRRIEAFDISNISGTNATASMVTFYNGQPLKKEYKRFKIRSKSTPDDFAMMAEVFQRRYSRVLREDRSLPDLILVDGGKGQLSSAVSVLRRLNIHDQPIVALAKRLDEVFIPGVSDPQNFPRASSGLRLLQRIRDEAHRFAVDYHRRLRKKSAVYSDLDTIDGIGSKRKQLLIKHFGSLRNLKNASIDDVKGVKGIPPSLAEKIVDHFRSHSDTESNL